MNTTTTIIPALSVVITTHFDAASTCGNSSITYNTLAGDPKIGPSAVPVLDKCNTRFSHHPNS